MASKTKPKQGSNGNPKDPKSSKVKATSTSTPKSPEAKHLSASVPLVLSAIVGIVAFLAGVLTPPSMHLARELMADRYVKML
ncbi:hypothetical protein HJC23_001180 [Cyclotella cryptica]|uniref:Uncharacterized protein n=1 Tax=Cyclotella cryptica TaxID=29204 RepID=A0ABD3QNL2_9STRA